MKGFDNSQVRRQDRLLAEQDVERVLREAEYGVLSMVEMCGGAQEEAAGYGVPLNVVWDGDRVIYFHCAPSGHKLECIDRNPLVSLCVVGHTRVVPEQFSTEYECVIVRGRASRNLSADERKKALMMVVDKFSPQYREQGLAAIERSFARTEIVRIDIESVSGKTKVMGR